MRLKAIPFSCILNLLHSPYAPLQVFSATRRVWNEPSKWLTALGMVGYAASALAILKYRLPFSLIHELKGTSKVPPIMPKPCRLWMQIPAPASMEINLSTHPKESEHQDVPLFTCKALWMKMLSQKWYVLKFTASFVRLLSSGMR